MIIKQLVIIFCIFLFFSNALSNNKFTFTIINHTPIDIHCRLEAPIKKIDRIITINAKDSSKELTLDFTKKKFFIFKQNDSDKKQAFSLACIPDVNPEKNSIWPCKIKIKEMAPFNEVNHSNCGFASFGAQDPAQKYNLTLIQDLYHNKLIATFTEKNLKFLIVPATQSPANAIDTERVLHEITPNNF